MFTCKYNRFRRQNNITWYSKTFRRLVAISTLTFIPAEIPLLYYFQNLNHAFIWHGLPFFAVFPGIMVFIHLIPSFKIVFISPPHSDFWLPSFRIANFLLLLLYIDLCWSFFTLVLNSNLSINACFFSDVFPSRNFRQPVQFFFLTVLYNSHSFLSMLFYRHWNHSSPFYSQKKQMLNIAYSTYKER